MINNYAACAFPLVYSVKLNGLHIGHVELVEIPQGIEIGYFIGKEYRNKG
ncbi:MAG: hypothetical protein NC332_03680 [Firmicutes bacterium]|nr:hypothetical protein [Bacillota bacterium]